MCDQSFGQLLSPEYSPLDPAGEIHTLCLTCVEQQLHSPHVKFNLGGHSKTSLIVGQLDTAQNVRSYHRAGLQTSTPARSKIAPIVDSEVASTRELILFRMWTIA